MAIARYKKVCIDAVEPLRLGRFWATALDLRCESDAKGECGLYGEGPQCVVWVNQVPEAKSVKHRVHFDIYAREIGGLEALGSRVVRLEGEAGPWTVMQDVEGGEYCAFLRDPVPTDRLHGLVVDSADPPAQARWWAEVFGARATDDEHGFSTVSEVPGMPILTMDFPPVPEPKTVKNRIHWDVSVPDVQPLLDAGATVVRPMGGDIDWHIMADPEGNEFCAFIDRRSG